MLRNLLFALAVSASLSASAFPAKYLPADTISIRATIDKTDDVFIRGDKLWISHVKGELPRDIWINHEPWTPTWTSEQDSDTYAMSDPPRRLPMTDRRGLISVSVGEEAAKVKVLEYPHEFNEWILVLSLHNPSLSGPLTMNVTISWKSQVEPVSLACVAPLPTVPSPTPVGLR